MSEWSETTIGEIAEVKTGPFGSALLNEQYIKGGTPVITVEHIKDFRISQLDYPSVTDEDKKRLSSYTLEEGDIVFSRVGSVDLSAIALKENDGWLFSSRMLRVRPNRKKIDPLFLSYYLRLYGIRKYINIIAVGSTMPSINTEILKSIPIFHCALEEQKEIAKTLSNLDKKITLLRQQNQDLEELAQTLFKRWFVEFEFPNKNGEPYKSSGGEMTESELGEIPLTWKVGKVKNIATLNDKQVSKKDNIETIRYIDTGSLTKGVISDIKTLDYNEAPSRAKRRVKTNSILYSIVRPTQCHYAILKSVESNYIASTGFCVIDSVNQPHYLYLLLTQQRTIDYFESIANAAASTYPTMRPDDIGNFEIVIPDEITLSCFEKVADNCWQKIDNNSKEIESLSHLRDTLLPKLMSGEVRVKMSEP